MGVPSDSRGACPVAFSHLTFEGGEQSTMQRLLVCERTIGLLLCNFVTFRVGLRGKFYVLPLPSTYLLIYVWSCLCGGEGILA